MNGEFTLGLAFVTGLLGIPHCLGMCSGLAGGFFLHRGARLGAVLAYHSARIGTYVLLGTLGALAGRVLVQTGLLGKGQGLLMIGAGIWISGLGLDLILRPKRSCPARVQTATAAGIINGLMPCSLVFSVGIRAAASADPLKAALLMGAFGSGTLLMALLSLGSARLRYAMNRTGARFGGVLVLFLGLWTLYEGWTFFQIMRGLANG